MKDTVADEDMAGAKVEEEDSADSLSTNAKCDDVGESEGEDNFIQFTEDL